METAIVTAIIGGVCVAIPSLFATMLTNSKNRALIDYRMSCLEEKVDRHNQVITRTYELEKNHELLEKELSVVNHRIKKLEK